MKASIMSVDSVTIFSLCADVTLVIFGMALIFLVLWQDARRRSNRYFALCMVMFSAYGVLNLPLQTARHFDLDPVPLVHLLAALYVVGVVLLFNFVLAFADLPRRLRWHERFVSLPVVLVFLYLAWRGLLFVDFEPAGLTYHFRMTWWGFAGAVFLAVYMGVLVMLLARSPAPKTREIAVPAFVLQAGLLIFSATPHLREYSVNTLTVIITVFMMGRVVIKYQVFMPLEDLNEHLQQKNTELQQATQAKAQFLANMSHELRTPLNSILGYTELVSVGTYGDLTTEQRERLHTVTRSGRLLLELINDVLDLSKLEAGRVELHLEVVDTVELLDGLLAEYEAAARAKRLSLVRAYSVLPPLYADQARVRQIFGDLLSNAIKFTSDGAVIVRGYADTAREQVVVSVTDTGPGIAPEDQERVFELYHQVDGALARDHEGTGLGLAIARRLTELHGGNLWFESVLGQGTTFHVALPAAETNNATGAPVLQPRRRGGGPVILALDGDTAALERVQERLEAARCRVFGAQTANVGLRLAHEMRPALITLDWQMPDMDGARVLQTLRHDPATAHTPVLVIAEADAAEAAHAAGVDGFLAKPVDQDALLRQVRALLPRGSLPVTGPLRGKRPEAVS